MDIAIYSRKSKFTAKGESTQNQIQICKDYCNSHFTVNNFYVYEDEGFSGGTTDRPQFRQMISDAKKKKFQAVACYRLDRISRNVLDFSQTLEQLNNNGIAFVSVTEHFNTNTPMGRAMTYIASVFAQLERETIAERIRDNMHELAKTGRWLGGVAPIGFELERVTYIDNEFKERSLVKLNPIAAEMKVVEDIYDKYLELGSIHQLRKFLIQRNRRTKNDAYFSSRVISEILRNPAYVKANEDVVNYFLDKGIVIAGQDRINGKRAILIYNRRDKAGIKNNIEDWIAAAAKHEGYIAPEKWLNVQARLDKNGMTLPRVGTSEVALLSGILRCSVCGSAMNVTYGRRRNDGTIPHYYTCNMKVISGHDNCQNPNANGLDTDYTVIQKLIAMSDSRDVLLDELRALANEKKASGKINVLDELKSKKERLLVEINNLVNEVSKSAAASKYIFPQIESRDQEVKKLDEEIARFEKEREEKDKKTEGFELVVNNILNFAGIIENLSNKEKKLFLQTIVDKVYWDGSSRNVAISLLTDLQGKKKLNYDRTGGMSQFYTAGSWAGDENTIILYADVSSSHKYATFPEYTLGQKIKKQRFLKGLTAKELASLCGRSENAIFAYESGVICPHYSVMQKICKALDVPVQVFGDDYFTFVLSEHYEDYLIQWRNKNTDRHDEVEKMLGISYATYRCWEKGLRMSIETFKKIKGQMGL